MIDETPAPQPDPDRAPGRARLSAYVRAKDEARMIGRVIEAARACADEVVLIDSGSTDGTQAIAAAAGARVVTQPWLGWGAQKRAGEDACAADWVLDLDADEIVTPELAAEIRALFAAGPPPLAAYRIPLLTQPPFGRLWRKAAVAWRAKLYDTARVRMPDHKAWDQLRLKGVPTGRLSGAIIHRSFRDIAHYTAKANGATSMFAGEVRLKSYGALALRIVAGGPVYFLRHYFLRGLWREGLYGFAIAGAAAHGRWLRDVKMLEIHMDRRGLRHDADDAPP